MEKNLLFVREEGGSSILGKSRNFLGGLVGGVRV